MRGPFQKMNYDFSFATLQQLDLLFFTSYAGRSIAPIVNYFGSDDDLSDADLTNLSALILSVYKQKWDKLKAVALLEYDPIHNFKDEMHEEIVGTDDKTVDDTGTRKNTGTQENTGSIKNTGTQDNEYQKLNTGTQDNDGTLNRTVDADIAGFNSATHSNANLDTINETTHNEREDNLAENGTSQRTDNLTEQQSFARTDNLTTTNDLQQVTDDDYTRTRDYVRTGNIGNITYQSMLKQEIELWKWNFIKQVLDDVKEFCTISIYMD